jgi:hypothetical protein
VATPIIQSTGSVSGAGVPGQGRNNLAPGETVTLSDAEPGNVGATYFWAFEDVPLGTAPVLTGHTTATPTFVTDPSALKAGSYRVRCTVNGTFFAVEVLAVPLATTGARIPSYEEEGEYDGGGNSKGWHEALTGFMRAADQGLGATVPVSRGGTGVTTVPTNGQLPIGNGTGYTVAALTAGTNVTITNGPGTITIASTGGGGGITQLTGDVTAGPGSGSQAATVAAISGSPVSIAGPPTVKDVLTWKGAAWEAEAPPVSGLYYVFGPSLTQDEYQNIYSSWSDLCTALSAHPPGIQPVITIYENFTVPTIGMPVGGWDLHGATLRAPVLATGNWTLTLPDGAVLDNLSYLDNGLILECQPTTSDGCLKFSDCLGSGNPCTLLVDYGSLLVNTGTKALIDLTGTAPGTFFVIGSAAAPWAAFPSPTAPFVKQIAGTTVIWSQLATGPFGQIPTGWISGTGSLQYQLATDSPPLPAIPAWTGTPLIIQGADVTVRDSFGTQNTLGLSIPAGLGTISSLDALGAPAPINLVSAELQLSGAPGSAGDVLTSQGAGAAPTWSALTVPAVIFDDSVPGTNSNIRSDRATDQSPIDNTKARITNFGSQDLTVNPAATGATGDASTISGGLDNTASGDYSVVAGGAGNTASGDCSHAEGQGATASGTNSHAEGFGTTASGDSSHAEGINCFATGDYAHAEGSNTQAINNAAHSEGQATIASADGAHAEGGSTTASGTNSHAEGESTVASNAGSHAEGGNTVASGTYSHAKGFRSKASRTSQSAQAGGSFVSLGSVEGAAQTSVLVLSGETPGVATNESVELAYNNGADALVLEDKVAYSFNVTATIGALVLGVGKCRTIKLEFAARREGGLTTIAALGPSSSYGDATTNTWTLNVSVGAAPDRVVLTFDTGLSVTQCYVSARVEFTEVKFTV